MVLHVSEVKNENEIRKKSTPLDVVNLGNTGWSNDSIFCGKFGTFSSSSHIKNGIFGLP